MNGKLMNFAAYGIGAVVLLAGSFFLFAALSGAPISEMQGVGGAFPEEDSEPTTASNRLPHHQDELDGDRRGADQVLADAASPLSAFLLPSGFSADELTRLENELERRLRELAARERELDEREQGLEQDREVVDRLFADLETLRASLIDQSEEQAARTEELEANRAALEASRRASFAKLAPLYTDGRAEAAARMLVEYEDAEAALILIALPEDRVAELVSAVRAVDPTRVKGLQDAYMEALTPTPTARRP